MRPIGITRKVDELGRFVIPIELRRTLGINEKDGMELYVDGEQIILKKWEPTCVFCDSRVDLTNYNEKLVCGYCREEMKY